MGNMKGIFRKNRHMGLLLSLLLFTGVLAGCKAEPDADVPSDSVKTTITQAPDGMESGTTGQELTDRIESGTAGQEQEVEQELTDGTELGTIGQEPTDKKSIFQNLNAEEITKRMGAGWNLGNELEASLNGRPSETAWGNPAVTPKLIQLVRESGFSTIRIPVSYLDYIGSKESGYAIDEKWMKRVNDVIDYAIDAGFYVIINVHGDGYETVTGGWLFPAEEKQEEILEKYAAVWEQIAKRYADYDEHLIFESMNEIGADRSCNTKLYANINAYNQIFLDTIRQTGGNNAKRWVLIPGYNTNIDKTVDSSGFQLPKDSYLSSDVPEGEHRIMVSVHYYDPWNFCGQENNTTTQWGVDADASKIADWGNEAYMEQQFIKLYDSFSSQGYPVVIGEYGAIDKSKADEANIESRVHFASKVCEKAVRYGLVPVYWDNGYNGEFGFALFHRNYFKVTHQEIIDAIMSEFNQAGGQKEGTATELALSETELDLAVAAGSRQIEAALSPAGCTDPITWTSSNDAVATVSKDGIIYPNGVGTAVITAFCNGLEAACTVNVGEAAATAVNVYILETNGWQTASSENTVLIENDGTYVLEVQASRAVLENIGSFYIKDAQVQTGLLSKSLMTAGTITVDSVAVNGKELTLTQNASQRNAINNTGFDICLLNRWAVGTEMFKEFFITEDGDYNFSDVDILDINTVSVTFTMTGVDY